MSYVEELEKQNEQLQQKLGQASLWVPQWIDLPMMYPDSCEYYELTNGFYIHAKVKHEKTKNVYYIYLLNNKSVVYITNSLEEAKQKALEILIYKRAGRDKTLEHAHG
jgi:hypothetical protein